MTGTVLLKGATGFVGRQVLAELASRGVPVRVVVRQGKEQALAGRREIESVRSTPDLFAENHQWWSDACKGIETVIHLAWYAEPGEYLHSPKNLDCLTGTLELARGAAQAGIRRFVGIGTCAEYDPSSGRLPVETPLNPSTPYAAAKAAVFLALSQWLPGQKVEFCWCRLFYLYGEREDSRRLVPYLRAKLSAGEETELTSGNQIRDYLDVRVAGRKIVEVGLGQKLGAFNICSGEAVTIRQLAERIADEYGRRDLLRFGARPDNLYDPPCVVGVG